MPIPHPMGGPSGGRSRTRSASSARTARTPSTARCGAMRSRSSCPRTSGRSPIPPTPKETRSPSSTRSRGGARRRTAAPARLAHHRAHAADREDPARARAGRDRRAGVRAADRHPARPSRTPFDRGCPRATRRRPRRHRGVADLARLRLSAGEWSNGSLDSFRSYCSKEREGSNPSSPTDQASCRARGTTSALGRRSSWAMDRRRSPEPANAADVSPGPSPGAAW